MRTTCVFFQGQTLFWPYIRNGRSNWCQTKRKCIGWILGRLYDLALWPHPWPWPWSLKVRVWNSFILGIGRPIGNEWKGCESSIHDHDIDLWDHGGVGGCPWWGGRMYLIVTGVTSNIGVPSTYLVYMYFHFSFANNQVRYGLHWAHAP